MAETEPEMSAAPKAARRAQILAVTVEVLLQVGLHAAKTRAVTERLGVGTGLLNHYFRWADLRAEAFGMIFSEVAQDGFGHVQGPEAAMERYFAEAFAVEAEAFWRLWLEATELAKEDEAMARALRGAQRALAQGLAGVLRDGVAAGVWALPDAGATALRLGALHDGLAGLLLSAAEGVDRHGAEAHLRRAFALECGAGAALSLWHGER